MTKVNRFSKSRRALIRFLASSSLLLITDRAWGATRPPTPCTRLGQKIVFRGRKYTCIKVNKKLVWDKGVPLPVATSKPSSSSSPIPSTSPTAVSSDSNPSPSSASTTKARIAFAKSSEVPSSGSVVINGKDQLGRPLSVAFTRSGSVLIALEAFCTHAGCIVRPNGKELACPCHYSIFDPETGKPGNPAQQGAYPLPRIESTEEDGVIYLWV